MTAGYASMRNRSSSTVSVRSQSPAGRDIASRSRCRRRQAMSYSISTLLTRNLHDVFGENDPARRRAAIDEIFTEDCVFYEPRGMYRGREDDRTYQAARIPAPRSTTIVLAPNFADATLTVLRGCHGIFRDVAAWLRRVSR